MSWWRRDGGWDRLRKLIDDGDLAGVATAVRTLDAEGRKAMAPRLAKLAEVGRDWTALGWSSWADRTTALRIAGAGCQDDADAAADWFTRERLMTWHQEDAVVTAAMEALAGRDPAWLGDLARRLAGRVRSRWDIADQEAYALASRLVPLAGIDPPTDGGFVYGWVVNLGWQARSAAATTVRIRALTDRLRQDPNLDRFLPRLFDVDEPGNLLAPPSDGVPLPDAGLAAAIATLAAEGRADRSMLLDRCLGRFLRGGTVARLRGLVSLHELLDPTPAEIAARARDYTRLLATAPPPVAALAQAALRRLDGAGSPAIDVLLEASDAVLRRTERKLVRAQLAWLDAAAWRLRDRPDDLGQVLVAVTTAFEQDGAHIRERALNLVLRHARHASATTRADLLLATDALQGGLARRARLGALGGQPETAADPDRDHDPGRIPDGDQEQPSGRGGPPASTALVTGSAAGLVPVPVAVRSMPPPIASPAGLAEEVSALHRQHAIGPVELERVLAALVALSWADPAALRDALAPVRDSLHQRSVAELLTLSPDAWASEGALLGIAVAAVVEPSHLRSAWPAIRAKGLGPTLRQPIQSPRSRPHLALLHRLDEVVTGLLTAPVPALVATPTAVTGHIDPAELVRRIGDADTGGWTPWALDLEQALLRLPREVDAAVVDRARRLGSPAGRALAARLAAGPTPDPVPTRVMQVSPQPPWGRQPEADRTRILVTLGAGDDATAGDLGPGPRPPALGRLLFDLPAHGASWEERWFHDSAQRCWPSLLPSHRDVAAAHLLPALALLRRGAAGPGAATVLPALAEADGPAGLALTIALVQGLAAGDPAARAAATDALVILARRRDLDGAALGRELAAAATAGLLPLTRAAPALRQAAWAGAAAGTLDAIAAALPRLLPPAVEHPPNRLAELIAVGADIAATGHIPARAAVAELLPVLAAVADRSGSSRLAAECRRLHGSLGGA